MPFFHLKKDQFYKIDNICIKKCTKQKKGKFQLSNNMETQNDDRIFLLVNLNQLPQTRKTVKFKMKNSASENFISFSRFLQIQKTSI